MAKNTQAYLLELWLRGRHADAKFSAAVAEKCRSCGMRLSGNFEEKPSL
jgi:hypothetical protein